MTSAAAALSLTGCTHGLADPAIAAFEANLASHASATAALQQWCDERAIAPGASITARIVSGADQAPPADIRALLGVSDQEPLGYRHVRLACGEQVLSDAHNWFVPSRLTADMNRQLAETQIPFGRIAAALQFRRQPLSSARRGDPGCPAGAISTHRARLILPEGVPLALVVECYTVANIRTTP